MHIHILGICGTFMGGIAALAREAGHRVTGCDANVYPPMSDQLRELGIDLISGYDASQLNLNPDVFVIGNVVTRGNPLMEAILDSGARFESGPRWLADNVLRGRHVLAVAGTHGKTTTSSMLSYILDRVGPPTGFLIGGIAKDHGISARLLGKTGAASTHFVVEADEYDTAFFDKRSKFVHYGPRTAILNNLEYDHADIFPDLASIQRQFHHLVRCIPRTGRIVFNGRDAALAETLAMGCWSEREAFGTETGWHFVSDGSLDFGGERFGALQLSMPGEHNRSNAMAAIAAARHVGVDPRAALEALRDFSGVKRRLELRGEAGGVRVYDDFAHHPTAIEASIAALRGAIPRGERILAVFEPRSNTMKQGATRDAIAPSLRGADLAFSFSGAVNWNVADALAPLGEKAQDFRELDLLVAAVCKVAKSGDHILVMSNGGFGGIHDLLLRALARNA
ncbi:MAG: UDP-N-acetylmuramate:L-alanyl-gamma-D-glutamyl-meso-diaminopimelate ligase [Burkholderiales bacterium]|nr:MAG: UDP-N-acetylmuramate:L-alanyl-gamma-D-glutamyl-meso-diaminopimelate ligase [Betaproteobacteria bacterium]TAG80919.1 MAG: UDP-N-acetylmuramate:L-alanyl-gamma-D-glutamyl-meso-diaminopimelate ligase [Burkholderiales bacterium]